MKPYIHATIIFAGFVMAAGTTAIVTAEYKLVSTKGQVLVSMLDLVRSGSRHDQAPIVAYEFSAPRDNDIYDNDMAGQLQSEVAPRAIYAPVNLRSEPARRFERATHPNHCRRVEVKRAAVPEMPTVSAIAIQPTPAMTLASFTTRPSQKVLPGHFRLFYTGNGKAGSAKMPAFGLNWTKNGVQLKLDEKVLALHERQCEAQFKSLPREVATCVQLSPQDQAKFKELGAIQAAKQFDEMQDISSRQADAARQIAFTNAQSAVRNAGVIHVTISDSDFAN